MTTSKSELAPDAIKLRQSPMVSDPGARSDHSPRLEADESVTAGPAYEPHVYSFERFLRSKVTVDDRALNKDVLAVLRAELDARSGRTLSVLEIGAGLGSMLVRLVEWGLLRGAEYVLLDVDRELLERSRLCLADWSRSRGFTVTNESAALFIRGAEVELTVRFEQANLDAFWTRTSESPRVDLLIANAVLDLVDVPRLLPELQRQLRPQGLFWFTVNFDGETIFLPERPDDEALLRVYHRSMDERVRAGRPAGDSKTGRHLFPQIARAGGTVLAAGASDWVVWAESGGDYRGDELYFLHHIIHTVAEELCRHEDVDRSALAAWVAARHAQAEAGELVYIAHQLDFLGRRGPTDPPCTDASASEPAGVELSP